MFAKTAEGKPEKQPDTFRWLPRLGKGKTCLHGVNLEPKPSTKVAAFDLDGCLIESSHGTKKKTKDSAPSFQWWRGSVPKKLRETLAEGCVASLFPCAYTHPNSSFSIVIITNQALRGSTAIDEWKKKIPLIGAAASRIVSPLPRPYSPFSSSQMSPFVYSPPPPRTGTANQSRACGTQSNVYSPRKVFRLVRVHYCSVWTLQ